MWITGDVELPDQILDAHERDELVFFVGAGASLAKPSGLPLFKGLAQKLARLASHPFSQRGGLDFFIGQLESMPQKFDAHHHVRELIGSPKSKFNSLHRAIVELAGLGESFRVVTTNYDNHISDAASVAKITIPDTWYAPALPLARQFNGLVHLHGSVLRPSDELILTDRDFGHAYITDAWATRFLLSMFDRFTVVFIGYSYDDLIMRYLALGLPSSDTIATARRYAFTSDVSNAKWSYLGIQPIGYPAKGRDHRALEDALTAWSARARMGQADHRSKMHNIISGGTTLPLPDRDYLAMRLRTVEGAQDFARATEALSDDSKLDWLGWLEDADEFKALFLRENVAEATAILGNWFARTFIGSPTLNGAALQTTQRLGQSMADALYAAATWIANDLRKSDPVSGERWQALLASSIHGQSAPIATTHLIPLSPEASAPGHAVFHAVLRPLLKLEPRWFVDESAERSTYPGANVTWTSDENDLTDHILRIVDAAEPGDLALAAALENAVLTAYDLLDSYHGKRSSDPLTWHRSAIEPHAQDSSRQPIDAIIDGLRNYGMKALPRRPDLPNRWWDLERALMRRLALHLVGSDAARSDDDRLNWLLARSGLYPGNLKHEVYQLLGSAVPGASSALKHRILDAAAAGPNGHEDDPESHRHIAYAKFNLLVWLTGADPDWAEARKALEAIQAKNPEFGARPHPDFDSWITSGTWGGTTPMEIEDFIQALDTDVAEGLGELLSHDYSERHFDGPEWPDALGIVKLAAQRRPDLGLGLWKATSEREDLAGRQVDLWRAVVEGWGEADLGAVHVEPVECATELVADHGSAPTLGRFLLDQIRGLIDSDESPVVNALRVLAQQLWHQQGGTFTHGDSSPLSTAPLYLNSWPGWLAQYWSMEVDRRWRHHRDNWAGLSGEESSALIDLLSGSPQVLDATQPAIAGELYFYFAADPSFATAHLLPIFGDDERHTFGWHPFLYHPRWDDRLLQAGLLDYMVTEFARLDALPDKGHQRAFHRLVASVVSYAGISSGDRKRLLDQTVLASKGVHAAIFAETVVQFIRKDDANGSEVWRRWLRKHLEHRLNGLPRVASTEELARWADVVPFVGEYIPAAVALMSGRKIGFGERYFYRDFPNGVFAAYGVELVAFFAERVRNTSRGNQMLRFRVQKLVEVVRAAVGQTVARPVIDAAIDGGFIEGAA